MQRYNSLLSPSLLSFQPLRRHYSQTSISRRNTPKYSVRDEGEDGGRRVKGLYELIRVEGVMIEGVDRRELPFPKQLLREEAAKMQYYLVVR